jgi:hypothetical protein
VAPPAKKARTKRADGTPFRHWLPGSPGKKPKSYLEDPELYMAKMLSLGLVPKAEAEDEEEAEEDEEEAEEDEEVEAEEEDEEEEEAEEEDEDTEPEEEEDHNRIAAVMAALSKATGGAVGPYTPPKPKSSKVTNAPKPKAKAEQMPKLEDIKPRKRWYAPLTAEAYRALKPMAKLQMRCKHHGLDVTGTKADLKERLAGLRE